MSTAIRLSFGSSPSRNRLPRAPAMDPPSDDARAFEDAYRSYGQRIYRLCLRMVRNPADAEELTHEAFLRAFQKLHQFQGRAAFSTWLHRVAVNVVLMRLRRKSHPTGSLEELFDPARGDDGAQNIPITFDTRLAGAIDRVLLERAIGRLSARHRQVFTLYDIEGYRHREIASLIGCSVSCSKANLQRARLRLRELLQEWKPEKPLTGASKRTRSIRSGCACINVRAAARIRLR